MSSRTSFLVPYYDVKHLLDLHIHTYSVVNIQVSHFSDKIFKLDNLGTKSTLPYLVRNMEENSILEHSSRPVKIQVRCQAFGDRSDYLQDSPVFLRRREIVVLAGTYQ